MASENLLKIRKFTKKNFSEKAKKKEKEIISSHHFFPDA